MPSVRSRHDRQILGLAVPALGALASEPLYVLVDTAIVGHIGTVELAALALATTLLTSGSAVCNFLAYGTTAQVARLHGAGREAEAAHAGAQSQWLALCVGGALLVLSIALAGPAIALLGGEGRVGEAAVHYLRIAALGAPAFMLATAGQGYLRGVGDLRTPLKILVVAHLGNAALEVLFVYGFGWGLTGSAAGTVIAQLGMAAAFVAVQRRAGWAGPDLARMRRMLRVGGAIAVRTTALLVVFLACSAILARVSAASLAAHQVGFQLFLFAALLLDALAVAGQVMIGRALGAADAAEARSAGRRLIVLSAVAGAGFAVVLAALIGPLPDLFTDDPAVIERARAMWLLLAGMMPVAGMAFALDGILLGAGDQRYLAGAMVVSSAGGLLLALGAVAAGWGIVGVWAAIAAFMVLRLATCLARFAGTRWAVVWAGT